MPVAARTGSAEQDYESSLPSVHGGPAFLVYYSPAFVRKLAPADTTAALTLLAEIYRRARKLWPLEDAASSTVTVRIDQIKELSLQEIQAVYGVGDSWLLSRRNDKEAVVEPEKTLAQQHQELVVSMVQMEKTPQVQ